MAEAECVKELVEQDQVVRVSDLSFDQLKEGAIFHGDIEGDFFLTDPLLDDEEDEAEENDEADPSWTDLDPVKDALAVSSLEILKLRPDPIEDLLPKMTDLTVDGGVRKLVLEKGKGDIPPPDSKIWFHYLAFADESPEPFDNTLGRNAESMIVGATGDIIPGLRIGLQTMERGEVAQFIISHDYAYGKLGCPPRIGKEATIVFTCKVVDFMRKELLGNVLYMSSEERNLAGFEKILEVATEIRAEGNHHYKSGNFGRAIKQYRRSIELVEGFWGIECKKQEDLRTEFLCGAYCNVAQSNLKLGRGPQACSNAKNALRFRDVKHVAKAYMLFARGKAFVNAYDDALRLIDIAMNMFEDERNKKQCQKYREEFVEAKARSDANYSDMCKSMFKMKSLDADAKARQESNPKDLTDNDYN